MNAQQVNDILIRLNTDIGDTTNKFTKVKNNIKKQMLDIKYQIQSVSELTSKEFKTMYKGMSKPQVLKSFKNELKKLQLQLEDTGIKGTNVVLPLKKKLNKTKEQAAMMKKEFDGAAMSLMFLGMAMQRISTQIWQQGTKTFQDVMHSVEGTVTQFDRLNAAGDMLKFSLGAALEPLAAQIIPIIYAITDWISENEKLVRQITTAFAVGGTVLMAYGMVKLGLNGIIKKTGDVWKAFVALKSKGWAAASAEIGAAINKGIGIVSILWALQSAKSAYDDFKSGKVADGIINAVQTGALGYAFLTKNAKTRGVLFSIAVGLELVEQNKFFSTLITILGAINSLFITLGESIRHQFSKGIWNGIKEGIVRALETRIVARMFDLAGINVGGMLRSAFNIKDVGDFDFWRRWKENTTAFALLGKQWDSSLKNFKNTVDSAAQWQFMQQQHNIQSLSEGGYSAQVGSGGNTINIYASSQDEIMSAIHRYANQQ